MPLLTANLTVTCPKTGSTVDVKKECLACKNYKHFGLRGLTPYITCSYEESTPEPTPEPQKENKGVVGLKRW